MDINEVISKSLDNLDTIAEDLQKSVEEPKEEDKVSKAQGDEDLQSGDVSEDAPQPEQDEAPEEDAPEAEAPQEDADADADSEPEQDTDEDEEVEKSVESDLRKSDNSAKALEVSPFLEEMVKSIDATIKAHTEMLNKSMLESRTHQDESLVKSVQGIFKSQEAIMKSQVALSKSLEAFNSRLDRLENQPVVRKSVTNKSQVVEKSFNDSIGISGGSSDTISKSEATSRLMVEFEKGNSGIMQDILGLEAGKDVSNLSDSAKQILGL